MSEPSLDELVSLLDGGVLSLTLNREADFNTLTPAIVKGLRAAIKEAKNDPAIRVVVITGAGRHFCTGADARGFRPDFYALMRELRALEKPVVAAANGPAEGVGAALLLACDLKICSATARIVPGFGELGMLSEGGLTRALAYGMGRALALEFAWTQKPIPATVAERIGLINKVVPYEELRREVRELVERLLKTPAAAAALIKRAVNKAESGGFEQQLGYESDLQGILEKSAVKNPG